jgi:Na+-translocating ferredoxin:NAD+ oxidoreductase RnfD subunit
VDEPSELRDNRNWRRAVWALRIGYVGLAVVLAGLILLWSGATAWVLAVGVLTWLSCAAVLGSSFLVARSQIHDSRPGFWSMRFMLIRDSVHHRSSAR